MPGLRAIHMGYAPVCRIAVLVRPIVDVRPCAAARRRLVDAAQAPIDRWLKEC